MVDCLRRGGVVVTGNPRAARALRLAHASHQRRQGLEAWLTPRIFDWDGWMGALWRDYLVCESRAPLLLTPLQERSVWKRIALEQGEGLLVVSPDGMAKLAQHAYGLLSAYDSHGERSRSWEYAGLGDAEVFRRWSSVFDQDCKRHRWMSRSALESLLATDLEAGGVEAPAEILLAGFDRLTPKQQSLLSAVRAAGAAVNSFEETRSQAASRRLIIAKDLRDEIAACAWWVRGKLESNADARIGIILQDVNALRGEIARTFRQVLMPESLGIETLPAVLPFEFSLGSPLTAAPAVKAALLFLHWLDAPLLEEEVSWLLLSGLLAGGISDHGGELHRMAQLDAELRQRGRLQPEIAIETWLRQLGRARSAEAPRLRDRFKTTLDAGTANGIGQRTRTFTEWVDVANGLLNRIGWSQAGKPDSIEFQARRRWERLLDELSALGFDGSRVGYREFVTVLENHAAETIFSPESQNAPVQILGAFESAGQRFDAIWFLGADDTQWPPPAIPHPLLPLPVQRRAGMPHSTPEIDSALASSVTRRLVESADACIFSFAEQNEQGPVRPSPLLATASLSPRAAQSSTDLLLELSIAEGSHTSQTIEDSDGSFVPWPQALPAGGASILKMQAACPFQAFASRRLGAQQLDRAQWGLSAIDRGNLLHTILETVWSENTSPEWRLSTRDDLVTALATLRLETILLHHIDDAVAGWMVSDDAWMQAYLSSEKQRLLHLLEQWFANEAGRHPFRVVATEQALRDVAVGPLRLNLRVDRVDELPDGSHLLLDYKTSAVSASHWLGARPDEPQLPLYAAYGGVENLRGILFAQIRAGDVKFVGRVEDAAALLDANLGQSKRLITTPYDAAMRDEWAVTLRALAEEFLDGEAAVAPKQYPKTCAYCALPFLCRVRETSIPLRAAAADEDDDSLPTNGGGEPATAEAEND